jgi:peptide/nickel transport system permease protein
MRRLIRRHVTFGRLTLAACAVVAILAPVLTPYLPHEQFAAYPYAPPARLHLFSTDGHFHVPFVYRLRLVNRLEREYVEDSAERITLGWLTCGRVVCTGSADSPVFLLGTDALGRDVLTRLVYGARLSLGIAAAATAGCLLLGILIGTLAAAARGWVDEALMRGADAVLGLPVIYLLLVLRGAMPLVLDPFEMFLTLTCGLVLVGWPQVARGVRGILVMEASKPYVEAAVALGASGFRVWRQTLPAAGSFVAGQTALLVSGSVLAEATLSYSGFGFAEPAASWGTMLHQAGSVAAFTEFPWLLAPALAIAAISIATRAAVRTVGKSPSSRPRPRGLVVRLG